MKINTGNFGNNGVQLGAVHTENPEALSGVRAEQQAAQATISAQETAQQGFRQQAAGARAQAEALGSVANTIGTIGGIMVERAQKLAKQKAELQLQDYQMYKQGVMQGLQDKIANGELDSVGLQKAYKDGMAGWKGEEIQDLRGDDRQRLQKGMGMLDMQSDRQIANLFDRQVHVERINAAEQIVAGYGQQVLQPGADVLKIGGQIDEYFNRPDTKGLYGASWATKYAAAKKSLQSNFYRAQIEQNNGDNGVLEQMRQEVTANVTDPATQTALLSSIDSKQSRNEARAQAAQNHADAVALRRQNAAIQADNKMQTRVAAGEIPTEQELQQFDQIVSGTGVQTTSASVMATVATTQKILAMPPAQAQQLLDANTLQLRQRGGTELQYKVHNAAQSAIDKRAADLKSNPQAVGAMDSGQPLQPVNVPDVLQNPGAVGAILQERQVNAKALTQKYGATAGKNLLTTQELTDTKQAYIGMTPDQRVQMWRNLNASAGPEAARQLATEMGEDTPTLAAVATNAGTPAGYKAALTIERGNSLLDPAEGSARVTSPKDADVSDAIQRRYPGLSTEQVQRLVPVVKAYHAGIGKDDKQSVSPDDMDAAIGEPVKVYGAKLVAPVGIGSSVFTTTVQTQINRLPAAQAANVRNNMERGSYSLIPDSSGNMRLINVDTQRAVTIDGKPFVVSFSQ